MGRLLLYHLVFLFVATKGALIVEPNLQSLPALLDLCLKEAHPRPHVPTQPQPLLQDQTLWLAGLFLLNQEL